MFHWQNNIYFGRLADGSVRILQLQSAPEFPRVDHEYPDATFDIRVPPDHWASIIASVSAGNEIDGRFYAAQAFHASTGPIGIRKLYATEEEELASQNEHPRGMGISTSNPKGKRVVEAHND